MAHSVKNVSLLARCSLLRGRAQVQTRGCLSFCVVGDLSVADAVWLKELCRWGHVQVTGTLQGLLGYVFVFVLSFVPALPYKYDWCRYGGYDSAWWEYVWYIFDSA